MAFPATISHISALPLGYWTSALSEKKRHTNCKALSMLCVPIHTARFAIGCNVAWRGLFKDIYTSSSLAVHRITAFVAEVSFSTVPNRNDANY